MYKSGKVLFDLISNDGGGTLKDIALLISDPRCGVNYQHKRFGNTVLMQGSIEVVKLLLERKDLDVNALTCFDKRTALILAAAQRHNAIAQVLLRDERVNVNITDCYNNSALWYAARYPCIPIIKSLIARGACVGNVTNLDFDDNVLECLKNWKRYLLEFTRFAKSNAYYPSEFKAVATCFILSCVRSNAFPKDIIHLLLEYIARAWRMK